MELKKHNRILVARQGGAAALITLALLLIHTFPVIMSGQMDQQSYMEILKSVEQHYGPSGELLNGEKYFYPYHSIQGNPFLGSVEPRDASVQIAGTLYEGQRIRYDILNQKVVLDYFDASGAPGSVVLRSRWVDYFTLDGELFRKYTNPEGEEQFAQVIYEGMISCICFWEKRISQNMYDSRDQSFSEPDRNLVLVTGGTPRAFSGRGSFLRCFGKDIRPAVKGLLKTERIRIRKVSNWQMRNLMQEIDQLISP